MMRRAGGYSDQDRVEQLYENMSPDYQLYIRPNEATSIAELSAKAIQYEKVERNSKRPPSERPDLLSRPPLIIGMIVVGGVNNADIPA